MQSRFRESSCTNLDRGSQLILSNLINVRIVYSRRHMRPTPRASGMDFFERGSFLCVHPEHYLQVAGRIEFEPGSKHGCSHPNDHKGIVAVQRQRGLGYINTGSGVASPTVEVQAT